MNYMSCFKYAFLIPSGLLLTAQLTMADNVQISPFVLYEQSAKNIIIDGVSTKYGLGVVGFLVVAAVAAGDCFSFSFGFGTVANKGMTSPP